MAKRRKKKPVKRKPTPKKKRNPFELRIPPGTRITLPSVTEQMYDERYISGNDS